MTMTDTDRQTATPAMTLYGKMLTFSRLQLHTNDLSLIDAQLATTLSNKTSNIPVIIDSSVEQDLPALVEFLWSWGLQPIGAVTGILEEQARTQRLAIFPADGKRIEPSRSRQPIVALKLMTPPIIALAMPQMR
jgi:septum site-determining protein MinC